MRKTLFLAAATIFASAACADASSKGSWNALFAKANGTCIGQSGLDTPEASAPVVFDDATGKISVLLHGVSGRGKARSTVNFICLYDKRSGRTSIAEYRWLGR